MISSDRWRDMQHRPFKYSDIISSCCCILQVCWLHMSHGQAQPRGACDAAGPCPSPAARLALACGALEVPRRAHGAVRRAHDAVRRTCGALDLHRAHPALSSPPQAAGST